MLLTIMELPATQPRWRAQKLRVVLIQEQLLKDTGFVSRVVRNDGQAVWRIAHHLKVSA